MAGKGWFSSWPIRSRREDRNSKVHNQQVCLSRSYIPFKRRLGGIETKHLNSR